MKVGLILLTSSVQSLDFLTTSHFWPLLLQMTADQNTVRLKERHLLETLKTVTSDSKDWNNILVLFPHMCWFSSLLLSLVLNLSMIHSLIRCNFLFWVEYYFNPWKPFETNLDVFCTKNQTFNKWVSGIQFSPNRHVRSAGSGHTSDTESLQTPLDSDYKPGNSTYKM